MEYQKITTSQVPFFNNNESEKLFSVNQGTSALAALEQVNAFLSVAMDCISAEDHDSNLIFSATYQIEMANALVESVICGMMKGGNHV